MSTKVMISTIPYTIKYVDNDYKTHYGEVDYLNSEIKISNNIATEEMLDNTLLHEIIHAALHHIGYEELSEDERLVTNLTNALSKAVRLREVKINKGGE